MVKKFGLGLVVTCVLFFGFCSANNIFINPVVAAEKEKECKKCGHVPSKIEPDCPCECHKGQTPQPK
jgi:hypothetical protein